MLVERSQQRILEGIREDCGLGKSRSCKRGAAALEEEGPVKGGDNDGGKFFSSLGRSPFLSSPCLLSAFSTLHSTLSLPSLSLPSLSLPSLCPLSLSALSLSLPSLCPLSLPSLSLCPLSLFALSTLSLPSLPALFALGYANS
jgi:hypothetical protein